MDNGGNPIDSIAGGSSNCLTAGAAGFVPEMR